MNSDHCKFVGKGTQRYRRCRKIVGITEVRFLYQPSQSNMIERPSFGDQCSTRMKTEPGGSKLESEKRHGDFQDEHLNININ
jgi:hypothetical protein